MGEGRELLFLLTPKQSIMPPVFTTARSTRRVGAGQFVSEQINALNSELRRLKRDDAASLMIPLTGKQVAFDDCRESDGTMIEAKGIGYAEMLQDPYLGGDVIPGRWLKQARSQVDAAGSRDVEWFFAEPEAARKAKELFGAREKLQTIKIFVIPAEAP